MAPAPRRAPANTTAPQHTTAPSPTSSGGGGSVLAVECLASFGALPNTAWSCTSTPAPSTVPGWITACAPIRVPSPSTAPSPITANGPRTTPAPSDTPSPTNASAGDTLLPPRRVQRLLQRLQHPDHAQARRPVGARRGTRAQALDEVRALESQRL